MRRIDVRYRREATINPSDIKYGSRRARIVRLEGMIEHNRNASSRLDIAIDKLTRYRGGLESEKMRIIEMLTKLRNGGGEP